MYTVADNLKIPIDHGDPSVGTYQNRYWVNDEYYQQGGPVIVYDVGEATAEASAKRHLGNSTSFLVEMLDQFGAIGIVWEHRYVYPPISFLVRSLAS